MKQVYLPEIKRLRKQRCTYREIGERLGVTRQRIHQIYKDYTILDKKTRFKCRESFDNKCSICGSNDNLEVHHKNGRSSNLDNLVLFCRKHHYEEETRLYRSYLKNSEKSRGKLIKCQYCKKEFLVYNCFVEVRKYCSFKCRCYGRIIKYHGMARYNNGCRCRVCKDANNKVSTQYFKKRYNADLAFKEHILEYNRQKVIRKAVGEA